MWETRLDNTCFILGSGACAMLSSTLWVICSSLLLLMLSPFSGDAGVPQLSIAACSPAIPAPVIAMRVSLSIFLLYDSGHETARSLRRLCETRYLVPGVAVCPR